MQKFVIREMPFFNAVIREISKSIFRDSLNGTPPSPAC